jgi:hypothetical protein
VNLNDWPVMPPLPLERLIRRAVSHSVVRTESGDTLVSTLRLMLPVEDRHKVITLVFVADVDMRLIAPLELTMNRASWAFERKLRPLVTAAMGYEFYEPVYGLDAETQIPHLVEERPLRLNQARIGEPKLIVVGLTPYLDFVN